MDAEVRDDGPGLGALAAVYALLAWFFAARGEGGALVLALCLLPFAGALVLLRFTTPHVASRGYAAGAVGLLLLMGAIITGSHHPQAAQLWWLHGLSVALAAVGTGIDATVLNRLLRRETSMPRSLLVTLVAGLAPASLLLLLAAR